MELIDAVDADGDGRGELLFRETSDAGTGWVIYRATADKLWKMFDSLNRNSRYCLLIRCGRLLFAPHVQLFG